MPELDRIVGMRNAIAHLYGEIDHAVVWAAVAKRIPSLVAVLDALLQEVGPPPEVPET